MQSTIVKANYKADSGYRNVLEASQNTHRTTISTSKLGPCAVAGNRNTATLTARPHMSHLPTQNLG